MDIRNGHFSREMSTLKPLLTSVDRTGVAINMTITVFSFV